MVDNKIIGIAFVLVLGIGLQVGLAFWDMQDTPNKAAVEFAKAYFWYSDSMGNRLCDDRRFVEDADVVKKYLNHAAKEFSERGFGMFIMRNCLYDVQTRTISKDHEKAVIRLTGAAKPPLRAFFTKELPKPIDEELELVLDKKSGKWKVCGEKVFSLPQS